MEAIKYKRGSLELLDQLKLPFETVWVTIKTVEDAWAAIRSMRVRGAPAIGIVGVLSLAVELADLLDTQVTLKPSELADKISAKLDYLVSSRPTAVNMRNARDSFSTLVKNQLKMLAEETDSVACRQLCYCVVSAAERLYESDKKDNRTMGSCAAEHLCAKQSPSAKLTLLTICNTGSLATAGYGTALGVVRSLHNEGRLEQVYFCETRPYNQGARLTSYELHNDSIPSVMICDNMAGWLMKSRRIDAVVVGADNVTSNGDVANKIGTYTLAVLAEHHGVPFYAAFPTTTFNTNMATGDQIKIEERPAHEMKTIAGVKLTMDETAVWNPAFDVTPNELVTGYMTEIGVFSTTQQLLAAVQKRQ